MRSATLLRSAILIAAVLLLEILCRYGVISRLSLTPPSEMVVRLVALLQQPKYLAQIGSTLRNILLSTLVALVVGFVMGVALHGMPRVRRALQPVFVSYFALPFFVLYPLLVVLLGMSNVPIIVIGSFSGALAMLINTLDGLDRIPPVLGKVGRTFHLGRIRTALQIQLPATIPYLFTGAKLAIGYVVATVIGAEFILSASGLGYSISFAYNNFENATMYALLLFIILFVTVLLMLLNLIERRVRYSAGSGTTTAPSTLSRGTRLDRLTDAIAVAIILLGLWQLLHLHTGSEALSSPLATAERIGSLFRSTMFWENVRETANALWISLVISCIGGAVVGVFLGSNRLASAVVEPMVVMLQAMPKVTLYPVFLLFFGLGLTAKVAFGVIHGIVPVTLVTLNAVRSLNPALKRTARALHVSPLQTVFTILLPATIPEIVTAVRLGFCLTFLGVMVGEMFASKRGLGFMIMNGIYVNDVPTMIAVTVLIGVFAIAVNSLLLAIERRAYR
jgi:NitT/TauT family transport system permease protein